jgi:hypothetical protein
MRADCATLYDPSRWQIVSARSEPFKFTLDDMPPGFHGLLGRFVRRWRNKKAPRTVAGTRG